MVAHKRREGQRRREQGTGQTANGDQGHARERADKEKHTKKNLRSVGGEISITAWLIYLCSLWDKFC